MTRNPHSDDEESLDELPEDSIKRRLREIAREEARAVYQDELAVEHPDGQRTGLPDVVDAISQLAPDLGRRETLKVSIVAFGYIAAGASISTAVINALTEPASAGPSDTWGTQADPWEQAYITDLGDATTPVQTATIDQVAARADLDADQTITTGTQTQVNLTVNNIEDAEVFSVDLPNNRITVDVAGTFYITAAIEWAASGNWSSGDRIFLQIFGGGSVLTGRIDPHNGANENLTKRLSAIAELSANDHIFMRARHDRGGDETIRGSVTETNLQVVRIG